MNFKGKPVVDATEPLVVKVFPRHIKAAQPCDEEHCALAQSIKTQRGVIDCRVGNGTVYVEKKDHYVRYVMDKETRKKIDAFDKAGYFQPGTYTFSAPLVRQRIGARAGTKPGSNKRTGKAKSVHTARPLRNVRWYNVEKV